MKSAIIAALAALAFAAPAAHAATTTVDYGGYEVSVTGPATGTVGAPSSYTATCGLIGQQFRCPYGEFRMFGGAINRLGEGFGTGSRGEYTFRGFGFYQMRYRVGASCIGSPRRACPIDVWLSTSVS